MTNPLINPDKLKNYTEPLDILPDDICIAGLTFIPTCYSHPEQYDVVMQHLGVVYRVGYARLRGGIYRVVVPDVDGCLVCGFTFDDQRKGRFDSEDERMKYLNVAAYGLIAWYNRKSSDIEKDLQAYKE